MLHGKAARYLRSLGHELNPTVQIGKEGVTEGVVLATSRALLDHELIKVKVGSEAPDDRSDALASLATATTAELVQVLGRTGLLYKRHPEKPRIKLPAASRPAKLSGRISRGARRSLTPRPPLLYGEGEEKRGEATRITCIFPPYLPLCPTGRKAGVGVRQLLTPRPTLPMVDIQRLDGQHRPVRW